MAGTFLPDALLVFSQQQKLHNLKNRTALKRLLSHRLSFLPLHSVAHDSDSQSHIRQTFGDPKSECMQCVGGGDCPDILNPRNSKIGLLSYA